ncbi:hypothetical protein ACJX0J_012063, partial [Zea mays]
VLLKTGAFHSLIIYPLEKLYNESMQDMLEKYIKTHEIFNILYNIPFEIHNMRGNKFNLIINPLLNVSIQKAKVQNIMNEGFKHIHQMKRREEKRGNKQYLLLSI